MKADEFQNKLNSIQEKIGQDASALILDDIATLITDNQNMNKEIDTKDNEISKLSSLDLNKYILSLYSKSPVIIVYLSPNYKIYMLLYYGSIIYNN